MNPIYNYNTKNDGSNDNEQPSTHIRKPEESHTPGFKEAARYLSAFIDTSVDPCEDFYQYTCGGFLKNNLSNAFAVVQRDDDNVLIEELSKVNVEDLTAVRQARWVYDACMSTNSSKFDGSEVLQVISGFTRAAGIIFPLLNPTKSVPELTQEQLAKSFALMSNIMGVSSLMIAETETNWKDPVGENPYLLYLDQASLSFDTSFYEKGTFEKVKTGLKRTMTTEISKIAKAAGVNIDAKTLDEDVEDMIVMESLIGRTMNLPQEARRKFAPEWNPVTVRDAQNRWPFMDWKVFLNDLAMDVPEVQTLLTNADFKMICKSPRFFDGFSDAIANNDISQRTLQNYLMYRLVSSQSDFINPTKTKVLFASI
uniref:Peptidase M13 N-terminal domain-containing protein n=1 Tax=Plectus sambesii TaxID=2011161 RepID=A0A914XFM0_9BILA